MVLAKNIIVTSNLDLKEGLFGQALTWILEVLLVLEETHKRKNIQFNVNSSSYGSIIPGLVVPKIIFKRKGHEEDLTLLKKKFKKKAQFPFKEDSFHKANRIWRKWFHFSPEVLNEVPHIPPSTLGIHYRGTDKNSDSTQSNKMSIDDFVVIIADFLIKNNSITTIFVCSDEDGFLEKIRERFTLKIISFCQTRSPSGSLEMCFNTPKDKKTQKEMAIAAMVDMIALSKCKVVLKTSSALSCFSKIVNPQLELLTVSAMKKQWFPCGVVKPYFSEDSEVKDILHKTMEGHIFSPSSK